MAGRKSKLTPALQQEIVDNLTLGVTIEKTCAIVGISERLFYNWCNANVQFLQATTRARAAADRAAVVAVRTALTTTKTNVHETVTFEETRLRWVNLPDGGREQQPYTYRKTTHNTKVIENPPDWRAGIEYLKRRDRDNWSDKTLVEHDWRKEAQAAGVDDARLFEEMVNAARQTIAASAGTAAGGGVGGGEAEGE